MSESERHGCLPVLAACAAFWLVVAVVVWLVLRNLELFPQAVTRKRYDVSKPKTPPPPRSAVEQAHVRATNRLLRRHQ